MKKLLFLIFVISQCVLAQQNDDVNISAEVRQREKAESSFRMGIFNLEQERTSAALANFNTCIDTDSTIIEAFYNRGVTKFLLNDFEGAKSDISNFLNKDTTAEAYNVRGSCYYKLGDLDNALRDFAMALAIDPEYAEAHFHRGHVLFQLKDFSSAIDDYSMAIDNDYKPAIAYFNRALARLAIFETDEACADLRKAIELEHPQAEAYVKKYCE